MIDRKEPIHPREHMTLARLQYQHEAWSRRQPWNQPHLVATEHIELLQHASEPLMGLQEELGELAHAHLKATQGIRGTWDEHEAAARDAVGDILLYLADYCSRRGWSLQEIAEQVGREVWARDWTKNPKTGGEPPQPPKNETWKNIP